ncbi:hypothetical protein E2986_06482 [Frieseomelitta varia]|uniref:Uncharacterized protein n=1 Tax=Frieseomelitta varia TaxID=561572 RepID=A0A833VS11_9HYME|nr:hypothetical protein E2986_06482 [Frieseomelitta varia]
MKENPHCHRPNVYLHIHRRHQRDIAERMAQIRLQSLILSARAISSPNIPWMGLDLEKNWNWTKRRIRIIWD